MPRRLLAAALATLALAGSAPAEPPKVKTVDTHRSPLMVEVTFTDDKVKPREVMLVGVAHDSTRYSTHQFPLTGDGDTAVGVWLDTIATIDQIDDKRLRVTGKDGKARDYRHPGKGLVVYLPDDTQETIPLNKLKAVRFLDPPRKDKEGNAMFDHWRFSPFTGERLPLKD